MNNKQIKMDTENKNFKIMAAFAKEDGKKENYPVVVAGTIDSETDTWIEPHDVTQMAVEAVRDYMAVQMKDNRSIGIKWQMEDNKEMHLILSLNDKIGNPIDEKPAEVEK